MIKLLMSLILAIIFLSLFDIHLRMERLDSQFREMLYSTAREIDAIKTRDDDGALYRRNEDD